MKKTLIKALAVVLALTMVFSCISAEVCAAGDGDETPFRITCTVNGDPSASRGFTWYTKANCLSVLEISEAEGAEITYEPVFEWEGNYVHQAEAKNLTPGTEYEYTVGSKDVRSEPGKFITDDKDSSLNFVVVADVQASSEENFKKGADT